MAPNPNTPFVKVLKLARSKKRPATSTDNPSWDQVEQALRTIAEGKGGKIELRDANETRVMVVYGEEGAFHIGITVDETEFHFYSNGTTDESDELCDVAWNQVPKDQVLRDVERAKAIIYRFFESGQRLDTVSWVSERF